MDKSEVKALLSSVEIKTPCEAKWEEMTGDDRVRMCHHCSLNVHNLNNMSDDEIAVVLKRRETQRVCVLAYRRMDGTVVVDKCPRKLRKLRNRLRIIAAAVVSLICIGLGQGAQASGGLVGAGAGPAADPQVSAAAEAFANARLVASFITVVTAAVVFFLPLDKNKKFSVRRLLLELLALALIPIFVNWVGEFLIQQFGGTF